MNIIRVFPRRTALTPKDDLAFVGDPPLPGFRPPGLKETNGNMDSPVCHISVTFTWDIAEGYRLLHAWSKYYVSLIGGPAISGEVGEFVPGRYLRDGVTFTSKGCLRWCDFCLVPKREGGLRLLDPIQDGYIIQDNNFCACPPWHRRKAYAMLSQQPKAAVFSGGIDARLVDDELAGEFRDIRISEIFLAADSTTALRPLETAVKRLQFLRPNSNKMRCYVMIGYNGETLEQAEKRLERVWEIGAMPFCQLYQPPDRWINYPQEWKALARKWSRPAAIRGSHKEVAS